jgi:hypothetical protein
MLRNLKAMPAILKWLTALCLVPPLFTIGTLIPNGSINVDGHPMANSDFWACRAGVVVAMLGIMMVVAASLIIQRSKYARPVALVAFMATWMSGALIERLLKPAFIPSLLLLSTNLIPVALMAWYLYGNTAVKNYFQSTDA